MQVATNTIKSLKIEKDSLNFEVNQHINYLKSWTERFNDEQEITEQFTRLKLKRFKENKFSGSISFTYPSGTPYLTGSLVQGKERGLWAYYKQDQSISLMYDHPLVCVGSQCCDGSFSSSLGRGTCSWHGGVCAILYKHQVRVLNIDGVPQN